MDIIPDWDLEQLEIIMDKPESWQLVTAGPGTGKTDVACQRIAYLVDDGISPSRILLVSFTRTAISELRNRIVYYADTASRARSVRISTIDSHAWSLRVGFDDEPLPSIFTDNTYDINIDRVVKLFRERQTELIDFMYLIEHFIVDEAQDVVGLRAALIIEMLHSLPEKCGVTIFADPAQAIYGFTTDNNDVEASEKALLDRLKKESPRKLQPRMLNEIYRVKNKDLISVFNETRKEVENQKNHNEYLSRIQETIHHTCCKEVGSPSFDNLVKSVINICEDSTLVLFRRRAEVLLASSYCSNAGVDHRLRMSGAPEVVYPWIGWLFYNESRKIITRREYDDLWESKQLLISTPFEGFNSSECWSLLHRVAAGYKPDTIDLERLRQIISRARAPVELCLPECGSKGPIIGTIHASKGREADSVILIMPNNIGSFNVQKQEAIFEEGRVYYVGATRARDILILGYNPSSPVCYLDSKRIYRKLAHTKVQVEIGRNGDVDKLSHLCWSNGIQIQEALAQSINKTVPIELYSVPELDYVLRLEMKIKDTDGITNLLDIGEMSQSFIFDYRRIWGIIDSDKKLKPSLRIPYLYLFAVTTIGLTDEELTLVREPFNTSGIALAPVVKGFTIIRFNYRKYGRWS